MENYKNLLDVVEKSNEEISYKRCFNGIQRICNMNSNGLKTKTKDNDKRR
jgi:hypothetical protein